MVKRVQIEEGHSSFVIDPARAHEEIIRVLDVPTTPQARLRSWRECGIWVI
jgi:hypothetical protein